MNHVEMSNALAEDFVKLCRKGREHAAEGRQARRQLEGHVHCHSQSDAWNARAVAQAITRAEMLLDARSEADELIGRSVSHTEIAHAPYGAPLAIELEAACEGSVEVATAQWEYWGTTEDGAEWRVHLGC